VRVKLLANFKHHVGAVILALCLLVVQAYCDLSLPNYTSDLVDTGIQQQGIEHSTLEAMRPETYDDLLLLLSEDDAQTVASSYDLQSDGTYVLNDAGRARIEELDGIEELPLAVISQYEQTGDPDLASLREQQAAGTLTTNQVETVKQQVQQTLEATGSDMVEQRAILFDESEYEALGIDGSRRQMQYLTREGLKMLAVTIGMVACSILVGFVASRTGAQIARDLRRRVFQNVVSFSHREMGRFSTASLITRSTNDIQQIQMVSTMLMRMVLYAPVVGTGGVIMVAQTNASMSWIIGMAILVIVGVVALIFGITMPKFRIMQRLIDRLNLVSREILTGIPVIRAFTREKHEEERFEDASYQLMRTQLFTNRAMTFMQPVMMMVMNLVSVLIVWTAAHQIDLGVMQVGDMIAFISYSMIIIFSFLILCMVSIMLPRASVAAERVDEICSAQTSIHDPESPVDMQQVEEQAGDGRGTVRFDHVSFRYEDAECDVLHDVDFTAYPGKTTAIIGPTGSGKSTLLSLVPRFYDVTDGAISIDGVDIRDMRQHDLRGLLGYAPQKGVLFSGSIADNIRFGGDDISEEDMRTAAEVAQATEFIESNEAGFDEFISQGGTNVSGGQRQRLSIARALATNAPILLFDDSFSALDYRTDVKLRRALNERYADSTVIIVAQRVATVLHADQIIVLDEGVVVGKGTHDELMKSCDTYWEIARSQLSSIELGEAAVG
jgi:ATP-binding cassette subfamily B multidrug efflux pump